MRDCSTTAKRTAISRRSRRSCGSSRRARTRRRSIAAAPCWRRCCATAGADVDVLSQPERGDHLLRADSPASGRPVMLLGHFDTVWPIGTLERMPLRRDGDRLHGPGTLRHEGRHRDRARRDRRRCARPARRIRRSRCCGRRTKRSAAGRRGRRSRPRRGSARAVLVLEPALPGGALKTARKGCGEFELTVHGIAAHAGLDPGKGASAIHELAAQIAVDRAAPGSAARHQRQRRRRLRRQPAERRRGGGARHDRRPRADARGGGARRGGVPRACIRCGRGRV